MWRGSRAASAPESVPQSPSRLSLPCGLIEALDFSSSRESDGPTTWPDVLHLHWRRPTVKEVKRLPRSSREGCVWGRACSTPSCPWVHHATRCFRQRKSRLCLVSGGHRHGGTRRGHRAGSLVPQRRAPLTAPKGERVEPATRHRMVVVPPFNLYGARRPAPGWAGL